MICIDKSEWHTPTKIVQYIAYFEFAKYTHSILPYGRVMRRTDTLGNNSYGIFVLTFVITVPHFVFLLGPMVWYQKFEYALGHWMQKATEHVLGCVLCSPGCFSLFRGSALMNDNVMKRYTTMSTEARHFVQYDQGEGTRQLTLQCH